MIVLHVLSSKSTMVQIKHLCTNLTVDIKKRFHIFICCIYDRIYQFKKTVFSPFTVNVLPLATLMYDGYYVYISIFFDIWCPIVNVTWSTTADRMLPWQKHVINEHSQGFTLSSSYNVCISLVQMHLISLVYYFQEYIPS